MVQHGCVTVVVQGTVLEHTRCDAGNMLTELTKLVASAVRLRQETTLFGRPRECASVNHDVDPDLSKHYTEHAAPAK